MRPSSYDSDGVTSSSHFFPHSDADEDDHDSSLIHAVSTCWRCSQLFDSSLEKCPLCAANNRELADGGGRESLDPQQVHSRKSPAIVRVVWVFVALSLASIASAIVTAVLLLDTPTGTIEWARGAFVGISMLEFISTIIVIGAFLMIPVRPPESQPSTSCKAIAWTVSLPLLAGVLAINVGYHWWLTENLQIDSTLGGIMTFPELWGWILVTICIQPAIVEELFFRHVALGAAREVMSARNAVLISSLLFAMAHLGTPLSLPTLAMLGMALGALRIFSGGLLLPILFHFFHNLIVVLLEQNL